MHLLKWILKIVMRFLAGTMLFLGLYALCYFFVPCFDNGWDSAQHDGDIDVYLIQSGVHTDIAMPWNHSEMNWSAVFTENSPMDSMLTYVAVGWGHKKFYMETPTWADLTFENAFSAAVGIGQTALHVRTIPEPVEDNHVRRMTLNASQYKALCVYIQRTAGGVSEPAQAIEQLRQPHDLYYEAMGRYHALRTCNTWVSDALLAAGQKGPWWTASTDGLFLEK